GLGYDGADAEDLARFRRSPDAIQIHLLLAAVYEVEERRTGRVDDGIVFLQLLHERGRVPKISPIVKLKAVQPVLLYLAQMIVDVFPLISSHADGYFHLKLPPRFMEPIVQISPKMQTHSSPSRL